MSSLRIVSYNILADCYVRVHEQPWNAFSYCSEEHISAEVRYPRIVENLIQSNADIILLQEVMFEFRDELWQLPLYLVDALQAQGYVAIMQGLKQKDISKNAVRNKKMVGKAIPTGLAIFWKNEKFKEFDVSKYGSGSGMTVYLQIPETKSVLCVNNIHLVGDPAKSDQHLKQLEGAKKQLDNKNVHDAVKKGLVDCVYEFVCGDFNGEVTVTTAPVCTAGNEVQMKDSSDDKDNSKSEGEHDERTRTVIGEWFHDNVFQRAPTGTSWASDATSAELDHMMYRCIHHPQQQYQQEEEEGPAPLILCTHCIPEINLDMEIDTSLVGGLPNEFHPSDHVMVQADFCIVNNSSNGA